jgi:hypothetical protein
MSKETAMEKYQDFARSEGREAKKFVDSLVGTKNLNIPKLDDIMDEESRRRENGYYVKGDVISEKGKKIVSTPDDGSPLDKLKCGSPYKMKYNILGGDSPANQVAAEGIEVDDHPSASNSDGESQRDVISRVNSEAQKKAMLANSTIRRNNALIDSLSGDSKMKMNAYDKANLQRVKSTDSIKGVNKSPLNFKGANSKNSKCWPGFKKVGTQISPSGTGETVNDCVKE